MCRGGVGRTRYGEARASPKSFFTHHTQQIGKAAIVGCARALNAAVVKKRASLFGDASAHGATSGAHAGRGVR